MTAAWFKRAGARVTIGVMLIVIAHAAHAESSCEASDRGCLIFNGARAMPAHLRDDDRTLPAWTTRCVNCHTDAKPAGGEFAPALTGNALQGTASRRGGPPSAYDETSFCRAIRTSIDPAQILLRKSMPQYEATDADCSALWRYIAQR